MLSCPSQETLNAGEVMAVSYKPLSISFEKWLWFQTLIFGTYLNNNKLAIALIMQCRRKEGLLILIQLCQFNETHYELNRMPTPFFTPLSTILIIYHFLLLIVFIYVLVFYSRPPQLKQVQVTMPLVFLVIWDPVFVYLKKARMLTYVCCLNKWII